MRLSNSISVTVFVSALASLAGCSDEAEPGDGGGSGTGGSATGGSATGGSATGGSATGGSATGGASGAATGGSATGGGGGGALDHPTDTTQAGIEAFLAAESYKTTGMGWRPEAMPGNDAALPHLATNRYFNETIIASKAAGNRPPTMGQHTSGSMSVKEILDGTTVIGKAATLRTDTGTIYYCKATVGSRCATGVADNTASYGTATGPCACHGSGTNNSHDAIPAP